MRRVFLDANVFVPTWVLDVLLSMAQERLFRPIWSEEVLGEYLRAASRLGRGLPRFADWLEETLQEG